MSSKETNPGEPLPESVDENLSCGECGQSLSSRSFSVSDAAGLSPEKRRKLAFPQRMTLVVLGIGLLVLLAIAMVLEPSRRGFGTHQQLGLPPCSFYFLVGWPCPSCGMTTSWSHLVRGQLPSSLRANSAGTLLAIMAMMAAPWALVSGLRGRPLGTMPSNRVIFQVTIAITLVALLQWGWRLWIG